MKNKHKLIKLGILLCLFFAFAVGNQALAATYYSKIAGDFNTAGNWSTESHTGAAATSPPGAGDIVYIGLDHSMTVPGANSAARAVYIQGDGDLDLNGNDLTVASTGTGGIYITSTNATPLTGGTGNLTIGSGTYQGDLINYANGEVDLDGTTVSISGLFENRGGGTIKTQDGTPDGTTIFTFNGTTDTYIPSGITEIGDLTIDKTGGASVYLGGDLDIDNASGATADLTINNGTLVTGNHNFTVDDDATILGSGTLNASGSGTLTLKNTTTALALTGTIIANGATVVFDGNGVTMAAGSVITVKNSPDFSIDGALTAGGGGATVNIQGSNVDFNDAATDLNTNAPTVNTDAQTDVTISTVLAGGGFPTTSTVVGNFTDNGSETLGANLTVHGDLTIAGGQTLTADGFTVTVYGELANSGTISVSGAGSVLNLYGEITFGTVTSDANTTLGIYGTGTINDDLAAQSFDTFIFDRIGSTFTLDALLTVDNVFNIINGTIDMDGASGDYIDNTGGTLTVHEEGTLEIGGGGVAFEGAVAGTGTILANTAADDLEFQNTYSFTGTLTTASTTVLQFTTAGGAVSLNKSVAELSDLQFDGSVRPVTLNNDLTIGTALPVGTFMAGESIILNGYTLTLTNGINAATGTIDASGSTLIIGAASDFSGPIVLTTDKYTNLTFTGGLSGGTLPAATTDFNDLTITSGTVATAAATVALNVYGDLTVGGTFNIANDGGAGSASDLTVYGDVTVTGTLNVSADAGVAVGDLQTLTLYGQLSGSGTFTIDAGTLLVINGSGNQFSLPSSITTLAGLTLNRPNGMEINANITTLGAGALAGGTYLTLTMGDLDLNGYNITLSHAADVISETQGNTIINTSATDAYISTVATSSANIVASGIGISSLTAAPSDDQLTARRYPKSTAISGYSNSISRVFYISDGNSDDDLSDIAINYDDSELGSNRPAALEILYSTSSNFAAFTNETTVINTTRNCDANTLAANITTSANPYYITLASQTTTGTGDSKSFDAETDLTWNTANNWSPDGVPDILDNVTIDGYDVTIDENIECASLTISSNGSLNLDQTNGVTLQIDGDMSLSGSASFDADAAGTGDAIIYVDGNLSNTGTGTMNFASGGGTQKIYLYLDGTFTNSGGGTLSMNGAAANGTYLVLEGSTSVVIPDDVTELHSLVVNKTSGRTVTIGDGNDLDINGTSTNIIVSGELIIDPDTPYDVAGFTVVQANGRLTATGSATRAFDGNVTIDGAMDLSGTGTRTIGDGAGTDILSISASTSGATLDLSNSTTTIEAELKFNDLGTLTAEGADLTFTGTQNVNFNNATFNVDDNTDLSFTGTNTILNFPNVSELQSLTLDDGTGAGSTLALATDLEVIDGITVDAGEILDIGTNTLTINGPIDFAAGGANLGVLEFTTGAKLEVNGAVAAQNNWPTLNPDAGSGTAITDLDLTVAGSGINALGALPTAYVGFDDVIMNRVNQTLEFTAAATVGSLQIISGTVQADDDNDFTVTGTTNIQASGTFDGSSGAAAAIRTRTFTSNLSGSGTLNLEGNDATGLIRGVFASGCNFTFTGDLQTNGFTDLFVESTQTSDFLIPSTVERVYRLKYSRGANARTVTLSHDLEVDGPITGVEFFQGTLQLNGYTITFDGNFATAGNALITATNSSEMVFNGIADFTNSTASEITVDETTDITFGGGPSAITSFPSFSELNNLAIETNGQRTLTLNDDLTLSGNLVLNGNGTDVNALLVVGSNILTIEGNVINSGSLNIVGSDVFFRGTMEGMGTYTSDATTDITIDGTASTFQLSSGITNLGTLKLDRSAGMRLNGDLWVGETNAGVTDIDIQQGSFDLNGYVVTLQDANGTINEEPEYFFTNSGATSDDQGYVTTVHTTAANLIASGIGVLTVDVTNATIRRYPKAVPISGVGVSTERYYYIDASGGDVTLDNLQLQYDNEELNSAASNLNLYYDDNDAFSSYTEIDDDLDVTIDINQNTPTGKGNVDVTNGSGTDFQNDISSASGTPLYFVLAGPPGTGGELKEFSNAGGDGQWSTAANWDPVGVPTSIDDVVIGPYTVTLSGNGASYSCASLFLNHQAATLQPNDNGVNGDDVTLVVLGNIKMTQDPTNPNQGSEIKGVNGYGRLNLQIGDGVTAGVSSQIDLAQDYTSGAGLWVHDFTINGASVDFGGGNYEMRVTGDFNMVGNSSFDAATSPADIVFYGGSNSGSQAIDIASSAYAIFENIYLDNNANVTTDSYFEVDNTIYVKDNTALTATDGRIVFPTGTAGVFNAWVVENNGSLTFWDVDFNATANDYHPIGDAFVKGTFTKTGNSTFEPAGDRVVFNNTGLEEIINTSGAATNLQFYTLEVASGASIEVNSDFQIQKMIDVKNNAEFNQKFGTISFVDGTILPKYIKNASSNTLIFDNLTIAAGTVYTSDNWELIGDLDVDAGASLLADNGTITFDNDEEATITNDGTLEFFKLSIDNGSQVTSEDDFTIINNGTNMSGAGLEVLGTGELDMDEGSTITFDATPAVAAGYPKTISVSSNGTLIFGNMTITGAGNNEVTTSSDFTISGDGANAFLNSGGGGSFTATGGEVTFTGSDPIMESNFPATTIFYSIKTEGETELEISDGDELFIHGNLTVNDLSTFKPGDHETKVSFNGSSQQLISGNSTATDPIQFADFRLDKAAGTSSTDDEVLLQTPIRLNSYTGVDNGEFTLADGVLNLGSSTINVYSEVISRVNGVINGNTGTYVVASTTHENPLLEDAYFEIDDTPTLYNLQIDAVHTTANDLTVNGELDLNLANLTIGSGVDGDDPMLLICNGDLTRNAGRIDGDDNLSRLVLQGTGFVDGGLSNEYFVGATNTTVKLTIGRAETLGDDLKIGDGTNGDLTINTGINDFDLGTNELEFDANSTITMVSGGILAGTNSSVVFPASITDVPASMFRNNECYDITFAADMTLLGDLKINGSLTGVNSITTGDNTLTFGPSAVLPTFDEDDHVIGNLKRTVTSSATTYPIGDGTAATYRPITLQFSNAGSSQEITISSEYVDPTIGRRGNPKNAVNVLWNITPNGTNENDSLKLTFQWDADAELTGTNGKVALANASFPAKWTGTEWDDYRNNLNSFTVVDPRVLAMASFPVQTVSDLSGYWAVFNPDENTDAAKDRAISASLNRIAITEVTPTPVGKNQAFEVTVQLQDQFGQPIQASNTFEIQLIAHQGAAAITGSPRTGVIPAGSTSVTLSGITIGTAGIGYQLLADTTGGSDSWQPGLSEEFTVLDDEPAGQATDITFQNVQPTSLQLAWTENGGPDGVIVFAKADTLLTEDEFPVDGQIYVANSIYGAGSSIGDATVVYNGGVLGGSYIEVTGLAPNTKYYFYVFQYNNIEGATVNGIENYKTTAARQNPNAQTTTGTIDDDATLGSNDTETTSKSIGTNTPVRGTIKDANDVDWFNFTVTNASPNVRAILNGLPADYNVEIYNTSGTRMRRGMRISTNPEAQVINYLPAGTYLVKIYGVDGANDASNTYTLKVNTKSSEIFSVTP